ncbi:beta strand repeat-containing protein, partial [Idiomarina seosinensis]
MIATVVSVVGTAYVQRSNGEVEPLQPGDELNLGDTLVTENGAQATITYENGDELLVTENTSLALNNEQDNQDPPSRTGSETSEQSAEDVLSLLEQDDTDLLDQFEETAAGIEGGFDTAGNDFIRLSRIVEEVYDTPIGFNPITVENTILPDDTQQRSTANQTDDTGAITVTAQVVDDSVIVTGQTTNLVPGSNVTLILTDSNGNQVTVNVAIQADGSYSTQIQNNGQLTDGTITVEATGVDFNGDSVSADDAVVLDAVSGSISVDAIVNNGDSTVDISGSTTDVAEGATVTLTITDQNSQVITVTATVAADGSYNLDNVDVSGLTDGNLIIEASTVDNNDETVTDTDIEALDAINGNVTVDGVIDNASATMSISGNTEDVAEGSTVTLTITDQSGVSVTVTATVNADGSYNTTGVDISSLADGILSISAATQDNSGNTLTATDIEMLDAVQGELTVSGELNGETLSISGLTADVESGDTVNITITDQDGNTVTTTATVAADGSYTIDADVTGLVDGPLTIDATATDNNGNDLAADDSVTLDLVDGALTVSGELDGSTLAVSGTTQDLEEGDTVNITITDQDGNIVTTTATVAADGSYTITEDVSGLVDGPLTIVATASDNNGNDLSANDSVVLDVVEGALTVSGELDGSTLAVSGTTQDLEEGDTVNITITDQDAGELDGSTLTLTGTSADLEENDTVNISITDQDGNEVTITATVAADGTYSVDTEVDDLVDGPLTIQATASDNNGNDLDANDSVTLDLVEGEISIDGFVNKAAKQLNIIGSSEDLTPGTEVEINITDSAGVTITVYTNIDADGSYELNNIDISSLTDGSVSVSVVGQDRNDNEVTDTDNITLDLVNGRVNVDGYVNNQGDLFVFGNTQDVAEGEEVTITITDQFGVSLTVTTEVSANGTYSLPSVDISTLADGELTLKATTIDNNGNTVTGIDSIELDNIAGSITVSSAVTDGTIDISGSTNDVEPDSIVTVTINDNDEATPAVTVTATVDGNGNYSIEGVDISSLTDGDITVNVSAIDNNENTVSNSTESVLDTTAPGDESGDGNSIGFADALINAAESTGVELTGAVEEDATVDSIVITDEDGNTVTVAGTAINVDANGNITINGQSLAGLNDGTLTVTMTVTDSSGNQGTVTSTTELDTTAPTLTVNTESGSDATPSISGTSDEEGATVTVVITDA